MFKKGMKVRIKADTDWGINSGTGGHLATVKALRTEPVDDTEMTFVQVVFDDEADKTSENGHPWIHWLDDVWCNDYEVEAADDAA